MQGTKRSIAHAYIRIYALNKNRYNLSNRIRFYYQLRFIIQLALKEISPKDLKIIVIRVL